MSIRGSTRFHALAERSLHQLGEYREESYPPAARKTLRKFAMREAADFLRINQNTFRQYISTLSDQIPTGSVDRNRRRYFTLEEIHEIQRFLFEAGKTDPKAYPKRQGDEPCIVISGLNPKKGSGTSTTTAHVAANLALLGYRVLCCDLDPQASLTSMFGVTPELDPAMPTANEMIRYADPLPAGEVICKTHFARIDLIPASMRLMKFEYETALSFRKASRTGAFHTRIANALEPVLPNYDVVIFDTPPRLNFAVIAGLFASQGVLIPVNPSMLDVMSLGNFLTIAGDLMETVEAQTQDSHRFDFVKVLITHYEAMDRPQGQAESLLRTALGTSVMPVDFVRSTAIRDAANTVQTVFEVEPHRRNRKTRDRAIESIGRITSEIEAEIAKKRGRRDGL